MFAVMALLPLLCASGELELSWTEGELRFPEGGEWTYRYEYRYPLPLGEDYAAGEIRHYFETAMSEMVNLVLPMYAADPDMSSGGRQTVRQEYSVTCSNDRIFSVLLRHRQTLEGRSILTLSSQVFAVSGQYAGDSLTLRGLVGVGESSAQLADAVLLDISRLIAARLAAGEAGWNSGIDLDTLALDFYPESHFYADGEGNAVFYLQPGLLREDDLEVTFVYSPRELDALLEAAPD